LFTQGLSFLDSETLLESSGIYGKSYINIMSYPDLKIKKTHKLDKKFFGEGSDMAVIDGKINYFMLTWREKVIL
jgi:glutaminyl-peptide cyclotransferase